MRRAGGVYYTPKYIVDYIVQNTVGKLLEGKTPNEAGTIKVLDPACGSGSFLVGAYQFLLDWYLNQYAADDPTALVQRKNAPIRPAIVRTTDSTPDEQFPPTWALTIAERKRILLAHIHGVDLDAQAVEVTKLNLLLKCLEGETKHTLGEQKHLFRERALPDLGQNIHCGNSLISTDIIDTPEWESMNNEERDRMNPFDYHLAFPQILKGKRKFDVVIGNPPYIFARERMTSVERDYYASRFVTSCEKKNTFMLFMEHAERMTDASGLFSFIVPNSWLTIESAHRLRKLILPKLAVLIDFNYQVFDKVSMEPCVFICNKVNKPQATVARVIGVEQFASPKWKVVGHQSWDISGRIVFSTSADLDPVLDRVSAQATTVSSAFEVRTGLQAYERGRGIPKQTAEDVRDHVFDFDHKASKETYPYLEGRDVRRYSSDWSGKWMRYGPWLSQPRTLEMFTRPRVIIREITSNPPKCLNATFVSDLFLSNKSVLTVLHTGDDQEKLKLLVGILNSRFISAFYKGRAVKGARKVFPKIVVNNLREFPFPRVIALAHEKRLVCLVDTMLSLQKKLTEEQLPHRQSLVQREIDATDQQIDNLVYKLYGLTDEEITIVEEATR